MSEDNATHRQQASNARGLYACVCGATYGTQEFIDKHLDSYKPVPAEDNATQGWEYHTTPYSGCWYTKDGKYASGQEILAALQRPSREAALVEALRKIDALPMGVENFYITARAIAREALISPPGLSTG